MKTNFWVHNSLSLQNSIKATIGASSRKQETLSLRSL